MNSVYLARLSLFVSYSAGCNIDVGDDNDNNDHSGKLVSIIAICCYNLSFLARRRPAEPCPLCTAEHNTICHWLCCHMCYGDDVCYFVAMPHLLRYCTEHFILKLDTTYLAICVISSVKRQKDPRLTYL